MKKIKLLLFGLICSFIAHAQDYFPKNDGVKTKASNYTAITNAPQLDLQHSCNF